MNRYRLWNLFKAPIALAALSLLSYGISWRVCQAEHNPYPRTAALGFLLTLFPFALGLAIPAILANPDARSTDPRERARPWLKTLLLLSVAAAIGLMNLRDPGPAGSGAVAWGIAGYGIAVLAVFELVRQCGAGLAAAQGVATTAALVWTAAPFWASTVIEFLGERAGAQSAAVSILINRNPLLVFAYQGAGIDILRQSDLYDGVIGQLHYSYAGSAEMARFHLLAAIVLGVAAVGMRGLRELACRRSTEGAAAPSATPPAFASPPSDGSGAGSA